MRIRRLRKSAAVDHTPVVYITPTKTPTYISIDMTSYHEKEPTEWLLSPGTCDAVMSHNNVEDGSILQATKVVVADDDNDDDDAVAATAILRRRSPADHAIPEIARNLTWRDSFYEGSVDRDDIIVAFDIDRTIYDVNFCHPGLLFCYAVTFIFVVFPMLLALIAGEANPFLFICEFVVACFLFGLEQDRRGNEIRLKQTHIAITPFGVYIDQVEGLNLRMRKIVSYGKLKDCVTTQEYNSCLRTMRYNSHLITNEKSKAVRTIEGVVKTQLFVDVVKAMMKHHNERTTKEV